VGYVFAIFHLLTHGVFKANLFLSAGSVMHAMNNGVDMRRFGALRTVMLITFGAFTFGYLAIMGIPPFSGFYSKDKIIHAAFEQNTIAGIAAVLAAGITGFYMTRMFTMTFLGKARWDDEAHPHESPPVMTIPLIVLALGSLGLGASLVYWGDIVSWLTPVTGYESKPIAIPTTVLELITLAIVLIGVAIAVFIYARSVPIEPPQKVSVLTIAARNNLYDDATNDIVAVRPTWYAARFLVWFDNRVVDGAVNASAAFVGGASGRLRRIQNGFTRSYALVMVIGVIVVLGALALVGLS